MWKIHLHFRGFSPKTVVQLGVLITVRCGETVVQPAELHASPKPLLMSFPLGHVYKCLYHFLSDLDHRWTLSRWFNSDLFFVRIMHEIKCELKLVEWDKEITACVVCAIFNIFGSLITVSFGRSYSPICYSLNYLANRKTDLSGIWWTYRFWLRCLRFGCKICDLYRSDHQSVCLYASVAVTCWALKITMKQR